MGLSISKHLYEKHFGLLELPFSISPDPQFSYNNSRYREAFAKLWQGIEARKGFIVITGEVGTGKTALIRSFMQRVESNIHTAFIFNPKLNFNQLLRSMVTDLGIECSTQERFMLMAELNNYLMEQLRKNHIVVLLIDEAQDLSDEVLEELRLLSNLETDRSRLIQIVLIGQPELERRLDQPELRQLKQRVSLRCRLTPLPLGEVGPYINFRLKTAGYRGKELFDARAIERIGLRSQGIPRLINVICDNALLIAYASGKRHVSLEIVDEVARDLGLKMSSKTQSTSPVMNPKRSWDLGELPLADTWIEEPTLAATWPPESQKFRIKERSQKPLYAKKRATTGIAIVVLVLMTVVSTVIYSQQNENVSSDIRATIQDVSDNYISGIAAKVPREAKNYLWDFSAKMKESSPQAINYLAELTAALGDHIQRITNSFYNTAVKISGYFPPDWRYRLDVRASAKAALARQWENLKQSSLIRKAFDDASPNNDLADSHLNTNNHSVAEQPALVAESQEAGLKSDGIPIRDSETLTETETPELPAFRTDDGANTSATRETTKTQSVGRPKVSPETDPSPRDRQITPKQQPSLGVFEVVQDSFLRDKPESNAAITMLQAGHRIRVESRSGDYFLVRSLDDPGLRGYVHREDAFFERTR